MQLSILPIFARTASKDPAKFRTAFERTLGVIFLVSIPISIGGVILGTPIMSLVFGNIYAAGGLAFSILMASLSFDYATSIVANAIFAHDRQKILIVTAAIGGVLNVLFDVLLIPHWGITGSAIATLIAQVISNWYLWRAMKKVSDFTIFPALRKIAIAGICMACFTLTLYALHTNVIINVLVSAGAYGFALYLLHEPLLTEITGLLGA